MPEPGQLEALRTAALSAVQLHYQNPLNYSDEVVIENVGPFVMIFAFAGQKIKELKTKRA